MSNEVEIVVKATDRGAARTLAEVGDSAKKMDKDVSSSSGGVKKLRTEFEQTSDSVRKMKEEFARTGDSSLWKDIETGERRLKGITREFESLGKVGGQVGKDIEKALGDLGISKAGDKAGKQVEKVLTDVGEKAGKVFGSGLDRSLVDSLQKFSSNPGLLGIGVGLAAALSPVLGAALGSAVAVGIGGGVLALGIVKAAGDARVGAAWGEMWTKAGNELDRRSTVFVKPLTDAADTIGDAFRFRAIPKIGDAFDTLRPRINDLAQGSAGLITNMFRGEGFDRLIGLADRLIGKFATELPNFGNAINNMFESLADGSAGIEDFWSDFLTGTQKTIVGIGNVVEALSTAYKAMDDFGDHINDAFDQASVVVGNFVTSTYHALDDLGNVANDAFDKIFNIDRGDGGDEPTRKLFMLKDATTAAGDAALQAKVDFEGLMQSVNGTAMTFESVYGAAVDKVLSKTLNLDQSTVGFASSSLALQDVLDNTSVNMDVFTKSGNQQETAILAVVGANQRNFDAMIAAGASSDQARQAYDANTHSLEAQLDAAGFTGEQIQKLIGKYRDVPDDVNTAIQLHGLAEAIAGLDDTLKRINHLDGATAYTYVKEIHQQIFADPVGHFGPNGTGGPPARWFGGITGAAGGGPRGNWTMVGEQGRELVKLPPGSQVMPHGQTESAMAGTSGGGGGLHIGSISVATLDPAAAGPLIIQAIADYERYNGKWWRT